MFQVKGRKAAVAGRTLEKHHIADHALGIEHAGQEVATELTVQLGGAGHGVGAIDTELAFQFVGREVRRTEIGVRVASGGGPGRTAEFSVEAHLVFLCTGAVPFLCWSVARH